MPTRNEFRKLYAFIGDTGVAGIKLKSKSGWGWYNDGNGSDDYGFSILPAGYRYGYRDTFEHEGKVAIFWTAEEFNSYANVWAARFVYKSKVADQLVFDTENGLSVRCLKD